jgi:uncharacterized membrane protein HdeD (DUF308 family)
MQNKVKWSSIASAAVYIIAGIASLLYPGQISAMFCDLFGIALIVYGIINIVVYFLIDIRESLFRNDFSSGIIKILLGVMVIYHKEIFREMIPFLLGIAVISSGFSKLQDGVDSARIGFPSGWQFVIMAAISIICGVVLMAGFIKEESMLLQVAGAALLYSGITDLYATLFLTNKINKFLKNGGVVKPQPSPAPTPAKDPKEPESTAQYVNWNTSAEGMEVIREEPEEAPIPLNGPKVPELPMKEEAPAESPEKPADPAE